MTDEECESVETELTDSSADECPRCGGPLASDGVCADDDCGTEEDDDR